MKQEQSEILTVMRSFMESIADERYEAKSEEIRKMVISVNKPFLTLDDVCFLTGLSKSTLYTYTNKGIIAYFKPTGKQLYFKLEDIKNFIMNQKHYYKSKDILQAEAETMYMLSNI